MCKRNEQEVILLYQGGHTGVHPCLLDQVTGIFWNDLGSAMALEGTLAKVS